MKTQIDAVISAYRAAAADQNGFNSHGHTGAIIDAARQLTEQRDKHEVTGPYLVIDEWDEASYVMELSEDLLDAHADGVISIYGMLDGYPVFYDGDDNWIGVDEAAPTEQLEGDDDSCEA